MQQIQRGLQDSNDDFDIIQTEEEQYLAVNLKELQKGQQLNQNSQKQEEDVQENNELHLKALQLQVNELMEDRNVEVLDGDIQRDFYILQSHTYQIRSKSRDIETIVTRRFSDFEWLQEELLYNYQGYFLPPLPQKGLFAKIDPKIEYLNHKKNELMAARRQLLTMYLRQLLSHRELKYVKQLQIFLLSNEDAFEQEKNLSSGLRQQKEKKKEGFITNMVNFGFNWFNKAIGSQKIEARIPDHYDEVFQNQLTYYTNNYDKLKEISDSINQIIEFKKRQAENMAQFSSIFSELKKLDDIPENLDKNTHLQGNQELKHTQQLNEEINIPLQQLVGQLELCIQVIQSRDNLSKRIFEIQKGISQHQNSLNEDDLNEERRNQEYEEKRMKFFCVNYKHNQLYFQNNFNKSLEELTLQLKTILTDQNKQILNLWNKHEQLKI